MTQTPRLKQIKNEALVNLLGIVLLGFGIAMYMPLLLILACVLFVISIFVSINARGVSNWPTILRLVGQAGLALLALFILLIA